jgi:putative membrane protein
MLTAMVGADLGELATPANLWRSWSAEPGVIVGLSLTAVVYARAAFTARRHSQGRAVSGRAVASFAAGWLVLAAALLSPLDRLGETLFAGHMAQHLLLIVVAAPLCVLGAPPSAWLWAIPHRERIATARAWSRSPRVRSGLSWFASPSVVLVANVAALWFWHFPRPYQAALAHPAVHALEHASFFGTAVLFWWVVLPPLGRRVLGYGQSILYIGVTLCQSGALGALLMFSSRAWYPAHAAGERAWGMTPLDDQQLAGLIMWIPAGAVYVGAAAALFIQWMRADERATRASEHLVTVTP